MEDGARGLKRILLAGAILGAALGIGLAISMDALYGSRFEGSWRDAIVHDLNVFLSIQAGKDDFLVLGIYAVILAILGAFGAFAGMVFSFFIYKFYDFLAGK